MKTIPNTAEHFESMYPPTGDLESVAELDARAAPQISATVTFAERVEKFVALPMAKKFRTIYVAIAELRHAFSTVYQALGGSHKQLSEEIRLLKEQNETLVHWHNDLQARIIEIENRLIAETEKLQPEQIELEL